MTKIEIPLHCCGSRIAMDLNEQAIAARFPDEVRKNVQCPECGKLVILSFEIKGVEINTVNQEVIKSRS